MCILLSFIFAQHVVLLRISVTHVVNVWSIARVAWLGGVMGGDGGSCQPKPPRVVECRCPLREKNAYYHHELLIGVFFKIIFTQTRKKIWAWPVSTVCALPIELV